MKGLGALRTEFPSLVRDVRGLGLMLGMELTRPCEAIVAEMLRAGVLANCTNQNVVRIVPPLIITTAQIDEALAVMRGVFAKAT